MTFRRGARQMLNFSLQTSARMLVPVVGLALAGCAARSLDEISSSYERLVVQATEAAANTIMEAAEAISDWLHDGKRDAESLEAVAARVNTIFEACTFQDVTGQRIRRAIQHLQQVETMLDEMVPADALKAAAEPIAEIDPDLAQAEIDRLLG